MHIKSIFNLATLNNNIINNNNWIQVVFVKLKLQEVFNYFKTTKKYKVAYTTLIK